MSHREAQGALDVRSSSMNTQTIGGKGPWSRGPSSPWSEDHSPAISRLSIVPIAGDLNGAMVRYTFW